MHKTLLAAFLAGSATAASASVTINFDAPPNTDLGNSASFGSPAVVATGDGQGFGVDTSPDLYAKDLGAGEQGLGLTNDPTGQNEIWFDGRSGYGYIRLDVSALLGLTTGASFIMDSTTNGEQWSVWASNDPNSFTNAMLSGQDEGSHDLPDWGQFNYYWFVSDGVLTSCQDGECYFSAGNVLLSSLTYTPSGVPEPATWATMLLGFGAMGVAFRRRRRTTVTMPQLA